MKTREGNFDMDTQQRATFSKKNHEKDSPNANKEKSLRSNRVLNYNKVNKLNTSEKDEKTRNNSKYAFVVPWQMPE